MLVVAPAASEGLAGVWPGEVVLQGAAASGGVKVNEHLAPNHLDATRNVVVLAGQANLSLQFGEFEHRCRDIFPRGWDICKELFAALKYLSSWRT